MVLGKFLNNKMDIKKKIQNGVVTGYIINDKIDSYINGLGVLCIDKNFNKKLYQEIYEKVISENIECYREIDKISFEDDQFPVEGYIKTKRHMGIDKPTIDMLSFYKPFSNEVEFSTIISYIDNDFYENKKDELSNKILELGLNLNKCALLDKFDYDNDNDNPNYARLALEESIEYIRRLGKEYIIYVYKRDDIRHLIEEDIKIFIERGFKSKDGLEEKIRIFVKEL